MFHFVFRVVGLFVLALSLVLAVLDIARSITASELILTPLAKSWAAMSGGSLLATRQAIEGWAHPVVWDPITTSLLSLPSWLVFWFFAMVLLKLGQRRKSPYGRFASR